MSLLYCNRFMRVCQCTSRPFSLGLGERTSLTIFHLLVPFLLPVAQRARTRQTYFKIGPKCTVV